MFIIYDKNSFISLTREIVPKIDWYNYSPRK